MEDRRQYQRFNVSLQVRYRIAHWGETNIAICTNIGRLGVCLIMNEQLKLKTKLDLEFSAMGEEESKPPIVIKGEVIWSKEIALPDDFFEAYFKEYFPRSSYGVRYPSKEEYFEVGVKLIDLSSYLWIRLFQYIPALEMFDKDWSIDVRCRDCVYYHEVDKKKGRCFGLEVNGDHNPKEEQWKGKYFIPKR